MNVQPSEPLPSWTARICSTLHVKRSAIPTPTTTSQPSPGKFAGAGMELTEVRFYTGIPTAADNARWNSFWTRKLAKMGRQGVVVYSRSLRYRNRTINLPDGTQHSFLTGEEKGIDVRIALDVIGLAHRRRYDVAVVMSQDQDFLEVAEEVRTIAREQRRWIKIASAFPQSPTSRNRRGIDKTDWIKIDRTLYDQCLDPRDYRPSAPS